MKVVVRPLEERDKDRWRDLFQGYIEFYEAMIPDAVVDLTWQRLLSEGEPTLEGRVAVDAADRPVGLAHIVFHRSTWSASWYCYLEDLYVSPATRGRGIGRALIEATFREADARGCTRTYWTTQEHNARARALYDRVATRAGFVQYRR